MKLSLLLLFLAGALQVHGRLVYVTDESLLDRNIAKMAQRPRGPQPSPPDPPPINLTRKAN